MLVSGFCNLRKLSICIEADDVHHDDATKRRKVNGKYVPDLFVYLLIFLELLVIISHSVVKMKIFFLNLITSVR